MSVQDKDERAAQVKSEAQGLVSLLQLGDHVAGPNTTAAMIEAYLGGVIARERRAAFDRAIETVNQWDDKTDVLRELTRERNGV